MTADRVVILLVAVAIGIASAVMLNWWTTAGMAIVVLGVLYGAWKARVSPSERSADEHSI